MMCLVFSQEARSGGLKIDWFALQKLGNDEARASHSGGRGLIE